MDYHIVVKWFVGLGIEEKAPDHSTLSHFKKRLIKRGGWKILEGIFDQIIRQAMELGVDFGNIQVVDSVHTEADVNNDKDRKRQEGGGSPRDPDARVVTKKKGGKEIKYRGYKTHVSVNAQTGMVTSLQPTVGDVADNKRFSTLMAHDLSLGLPVDTYAGDKAYDDLDIHLMIEEAGLHSAINLKGNRLGKKDSNKGKWLALVNSDKYQEGRRQRYRVEQPFGIVKAWHGFGRCRYLGLIRYGIQSYLTFLVHNVKRMIKLLTGITFRPLAKGRRAEKFTPIYAV